MGRWRKSIACATPITATTNASRHWGRRAWPNPSGSCSGHVTLLQGQQAQSHGLHGNWFDRVQPTYAASLGAFVQALEDDREVPITLREGLKSQAIAQAAVRSAASGRGETIDYSL
ncbi:Gfo/Idh/MocA family oxidoreductase [Glutamicibacter halophytocola]|uniref:Gfo/Idh/MocA family oxidoreductase n=1 Tax=Glutamicibacter halophytocola TaxID=1933880 RepID=UPI00321A671B